MKNKNLWVVLFGIALGVALSANVPVIPDWFMSTQISLMGGGGYGSY